MSDDTPTYAERVRALSPSVWSWSVGSAWSVGSVQTDQMVNRMMALEIATEADATIADLRADVQRLTERIKIDVEEIALRDDDLAAALQRIGELERLLRRYRAETPLGHQPHMIAGEVDDILESPDV